MAEKDANFFKPEAKLSTKESLYMFIWNPRTKEFCGRTGSSWLKILIFYIIFYLCLAAFWALMLLIFYQTIDDRQPKWQLGESRIGVNPGLGFRPRPPEKNIGSTLIWFKHGDKESSWGHWANDLDKFLENYDKGGDDKGQHVDSCTNNESPAPTKFCFFDIKKLGNICSKSNEFGYRKGEPCVLIKLNRIFGWKPDSYNTSDFTSNLNIPDAVRQSYAQHSSQKIYITCEGENPADKENIGTVEYFPPDGGIEFKYFPFTNQPGYLSPFVFVHFQKPAYGVLINVECKAWAKNIKHDRMDREGSVHFELLIDGF